MVALAIDLLRWLIKSLEDDFPEKDPTQSSGVILIDELDVHLHPEWQRQVGDWLRQNLPERIGNPYLLTGRIDEFAYLHQWISRIPKRIAHSHAMMARKKVEKLELCSGFLKQSQKKGL